MMVAVDVTAVSLRAGNAPLPSARPPSLPIAPHNHAGGASGPSAARSSSGWNDADAAALRAADGRGGPLSPRWLDLILLLHQK
jgi:hypothetical protein